MTPTTKRTVVTGMAAALVLVAVGCSNRANSATIISPTTTGAPTTAPWETLATPTTAVLATAAPTTSGAPTAAPTTKAATTSAPTTVVTTSAPTDAPTAAATGSDQTTAAGDTLATSAPLAQNADIPVAPPAVRISAVGRKSGPGTLAIQQRLTDLGFWAGDLDGKYGLATTQAVMAFQKYVGLTASASVDQATADALTAATLRAKATTKDLDGVEIDKGKQLLFIVHGGQAQWVLNTSTASGKFYSEPDHNSPGSTLSGTAITYNGHFKINRERPDGWWSGDLGQIYRPKYFNGGEAIHGLGSVPNYPASHGCVRVSVPAMDFIWSANLIPLGSRVWVHD